MMKFNENLRYLRKRENMTQEKLAERLNVTRQAVTKWESGTVLPDLENLMEISYLFGISIDDLLGSDKVKNSTGLDKKLRDLPLLMIGLMFMVLIVILEIGATEPLVMMGVLLLAAPIEALYIIRYLKPSKIINMNPDKEGRKDRIKFCLTNSLMFAGFWFFIDLIGFTRGIEGHSLIKVFTDTLILFVISLVMDIWRIKSKMKKYNEKV